MSSDYLELRKAASRTTPFARKQARGQASAVADVFFNSPLDNPFGSLPMTLMRVQKVFQCLLLVRRK